MNNKLGSNIQLNTEKYYNLCYSDQKNKEIPQKNYTLRTKQKNNKFSKITNHKIYLINIIFLKQ